MVDYGHPGCSFVCGMAGKKSFAVVALIRYETLLPALMRLVNALFNAC